jgi:hypothetical protein
VPRTFLYHKRVRGAFFFAADECPVCIILSHPSSMLNQPQSNPLVLPSFGGRLLCRSAVRRKRSRDPLQTQAEGHSGDLPRLVSEEEAREPKQAL